MNISKFYSPEGAAIKCFKCGSTNIKHVTRSVIPVLDNGSGPECEFSEECAHCGTTLAYWAYGAYGPSFVPRSKWQALTDRFRSWVRRIAFNSWVRRITAKL